MIEFVPAMLVGSMVRHEIELTITSLASELGALFHLKLNLLPVIGLEVIMIALL